MPFVKYIAPKKGRKPVARPPKVNVLQGGQISLNSVAYAEYLKGAKYIELYYDPKAMKIGLKPKKYPVKTGFPLKVVGKGKSTYRVYAKPLMEHYDIKIAKKLTVTPQWNKSEGLLELAL